MSFQPPNILHYRAVPVGAVISFALALATFAVLVMVALQGIGLVEWGMQ